MHGHLEVDDDEEDDDGGHEIDDIGQVLAVERLLQRAHLVGARDQQVEHRDDGALELVACVTTSKRSAIDYYRSFFIAYEATH